MQAGKLYGVSVGPGDPELLTLKAVRIIREADVVAVPNIGHKRQTARDIAAEFLEGKVLLDCRTPMTSDRDAVAAAYRVIADDVCTLLAEGKTVAYLVMGDATIYSTYMNIHDMVRARGYEAEVVPGVTSFCAAAARMGVALCEGPERLLIVPVLAGGLDDTLDVSANKVFMKAGHALGELRDALAKRHLLDRARMVANCGLPDERVVMHLDDADTSSDYFSVVVLKEPRDA